MLVRVLAVIVCSSVRLSHAGIVPKQTNIVSLKQRHVIAQAVYLTPTVLGGTPQPHSPEICAESDPHPFEHNDFDQYPLIVPQPWELAKNV